MAVVEAATLVVRRVTSRGIARKVVREIRCSAIVAVVLATFLVIVRKVMVLCVTSAKDLDILRISAPHNVFA